MKAYRIQNDIVAAPDEQAAIVCWGGYDDRDVASAGPVEEVPLTLEINIEEESGSFRTGTLAEVMPADGEPAQLVCEGECDC